MITPVVLMGLFVTFIMVMLSVGGFPKKEDLKDFGGFSIIVLRAAVIADVILLIINTAIKSLV